LQRRGVEQTLASFVHNRAAEETATPDVLGSWHYGRYLTIVLLVPTLVFVLTFPVGASEGFLGISRRTLWHATHYRFILPPQQNCDVVIAGDSSGMIGVDPHALQARTGWKTCNIALPYIGTALAGTRVLDAYLAHNRPPLFIVFHLSDNHLHSPILKEDNGIVDGWLMVDEHFPLSERLRIFAKHPLDTLRFVTAVWKEFLVTKRILRPDWTRGSYRADMESQIANRGWMAEEGTTPDVVCGWQAPELYTERSYLDSLTAQYTRGGTRGVIWANPARDCDDRIAQYRENARALGLLPTSVYPHALFFDAFHLNAEGAARNAIELGNYLESLQRRH
jgi:hypothetical protein